jgi:hypothetical protein
MSLGLPFSVGTHQRFLILAYNDGTNQKLTFFSVGDWLQGPHVYAHLTYLTFFLAGDWLQGPHVYALYDSYGMSTHQIEVLFVAGFGSSMIFGTIVGSFADKL